MYQIAVYISDDYRVEILKKVGKYYTTVVEVPTEQDAMEWFKDNNIPDSEIAETTFI